MKRFLLILLLLPAFAYASVSGMDDVNPNIPQETQDILDEAVTTYYQHPNPHTVGTILDIMNDSKLLRKKTAWPPMIGFLTVIFADNKEHLFDWMSRNDYNTYAQDVFIAALMHAKLKETALVFAQAHQWKKAKLEEIRSANDGVDLKHFVVAVPGHIDTLWGAFFASGDKIYVNEIIDALLADKLPETDVIPTQSPYDFLKENKKLAESSLRQYAPSHEPVREALATYIKSEKDETKRDLLKSILRSSQHTK